MKITLSLLALTFALPALAKPTCEIKFDKGYKLEMAEKHKDALSSAYTYFNHELLEGNPSELTKEYKIKMSWHIDHARTKVKLWDKNGEEYGLELFLAQRFFDRKTLVLNTQVYKVKEYQITRGVEPNTTIETRRAPHFRIKNIDRTTFDQYLVSGVSGKSEIHVKDGSAGPDLFIDVEFKDIDVSVNCYGDLRE